MILKKALFIALAVSLLAGLGSSFLPGRASAFTPNYNQSNLIDNGTFLNKNTMSAGQIQTFLNSVGSGIKNYSDIERCSTRTAPYYHHCNQRISAAQIIYDAGQAYGINPRAIIATIQKEEGLITNPDPSSFAITHAMGYGCPDSGGCSGYSGFFNQVDNGTWQFRVDYELSSGHSWWGYSPADYPCAGSTRYYTPGLLPGNTVSFKDDYGTVYKRFKLDNASTGTLYCYTPHAYPGSSREYYSGSYWFVYYFQKWFGSTQSTSPYAGIVESRSSYSDSARTRSFSEVPTVTPNGKYYLRITARNIGYQSWSQSFMHVGTSGPRDRTSAFQDSSWISPTRPGASTESSVAPGDVATFDFILEAPPQTGSYKECFGLVADGHAWLHVSDVCYNLNVVAPIAAPNSTHTGLTAGQMLHTGEYLLSPDTLSTFVLQKDGNLVLYSGYRSVWNAHTAGKPSSYAVMQADGNLVLYDKNSNALWNSRTNHNSGSYLTLQSDGNLVIYKSSTPLWNTNTVHNPNLLGYVSTTLPTATLYPGQPLETADRRFKLVLQNDGNLVLYSPNRATWNSRTANKDSAYLKMQADGNMVIYDSSDHPLWDTNTYHHSGVHLVVQPDGNLVLYDGRNNPVWNTMTNGVQ